jgi:hypothetical protein
MKFALPILAAVLSLQAGVANAAQPTHTGQKAWTFIRDGLDNKQFDVITATAPGVFTGFRSTGYKSQKGWLYMICNWGVSGGNTQPFYTCYRIDSTTGLIDRRR